VHIPKVVGSFPTDPKFKVELFNLLHLDSQSHKEYTKKHHGTHRKWTGIFIDIICYGIMRLAGYIAAPKSAAYKALKHFMH